MQNRNYFLDDTIDAMADFVDVMDIGDTVSGVNGIYVANVSNGVCFVDID